METLSINNSAFERRNQSIGWAVSVGFHTLIFLLLIFSMAWHTPVEEPEDYGIEVNFGLDDKGYGENQTMNPAGEEPSPQQSQATPTPTEAQESQESPETSEPEKVITGNDESVTVSAQPSPVQKSTHAPDVVTPPSPKPSSQSLFPGEASNASNNNGDKKGTVGDMGVKNGNPDARSNYSGTVGNGNNRNSSLDMTGWKWDSRPSVNDQSDEEGRIVFQIKVDEDGNIVSVNVLEKNVSAALVKKYQKEVESLSFSRTSGGNNGEGASGKITFIITSK